MIIPDYSNKVAVIYDIYIYMYVYIYNATHLSSKNSNTISYFYFCYAARGATARSNNHYSIHFEQQPANIIHILGTFFTRTDTCWDARHVLNVVSSACCAGNAAHLLAVMICFPFLIQLYAPAR